MSRASGKIKDVTDGKSESTDSDEDEENGGEAGREETPDLYRHSALGMCVFIGHSST
jgi:E3 ubiquitin-protein ligase HUWE1